MAISKAAFRELRKRMLHTAADPPRRRMSSQTAVRTLRKRTLNTIAGMPRRRIYSKAAVRSELLRNLREEGTWKVRGR